MPDSSSRISHVMTPYMQRKIMKIMCVVDKQCYMNIVNLLDV